MAPLLKSRTFHLFFLAYTGLLVFLGRQNFIGLSNYDDSVYAQKAKEILSSGNLWLLTLNNIPTHDNVPFPMWMMAISFKLFGISNYSAVLPTALFGVATILLTYLLAEHLFEDRFISFLAAFVIIFPGFFCDYARRAMVDVTLTFFVAAALFSLLKAATNRKFYLLFGLFTALAILSKSILGVFPLLIGISYLILSRQIKELVDPYFLTGLLLALGLGSSWHIINWLESGDPFLAGHFGELLLERALPGPGNPFYFLGYARDLANNYWPWLPFVVFGLFTFTIKFFRDRDRNSLFLLLWIAWVFLVMSAARSQSLRYILSIFPAMAIVAAKVIGDWFSEERQAKAIPYMVGTVLFVVLFINATDIEVRQAVSLSPNSVAVRHLAPLVTLNTTADQEIMNFRLSDSNPRLAMLFYGDRYISAPVKDVQGLMSLVEKKPQLTWLTPLETFKSLHNQFPDKFYLIQSYERYAYFTAKVNRENIRYDVSPL